MGDGGFGQPARWSPMETHHCQAKQPSVSPRPNKQWFFTTAQRGTCKNMLNIYLVQLFSNRVCGNNKGCLRAPRAGSHNIRVYSEKTKTTKKKKLGGIERTKMLSIYHKIKYVPLTLYV